MQIGGLNYGTRFMRKEVYQSMYVFFFSCTACMFWLNQLCGKVMLSWNETEVKKKFNFSDICIKWDCTVSENK